MRFRVTFNEVSVCSTTRVQANGPLVHIIFKNSVQPFGRIYLNSYIGYGKQPFSPSKPAPSTDPLSKTPNTP